MRRAPWLLLALALAACGPSVEPPAPVSQGGRGPLAIEVSGWAPEYHRPASWWERYHPRLVAVGEADGSQADGSQVDETTADFSERECLACHDPRTSCNRCHAYAGVRAVLSVWQGEP